jgi:hypothetical protein
MRPRPSNSVKACRRWIKMGWRGRSRAISKADTGEAKKPPWRVRRWSWRMPTE